MLRLISDCKDRRGFYFSGNSTEKVRLNAKPFKEEMKLTTKQTKWLRFRQRKTPNVTRKCPNMPWKGQFIILKNHLITKEV